MEVSEPQNCVVKSARDSYDFSIGEKTVSTLKCLNVNEPKLAAYNNFETYLKAHRAYSRYYDALYMHYANNEKIPDSLMAYITESAAEEM